MSAEAVLWTSVPAAALAYSQGRLQAEPQAHSNSEPGALAASTLLDPKRGPSLSCRSDGCEAYP